MITENDYFKTENITIDGHRTSVRLEAPFWDALATVCEVNGYSTLDVYRKVYRSSGSGNFSSKLRSFIVRELNEIIRNNVRGLGPVSKEVADDWYGPETATFGDRLAAAREMSGLTQDQLAQRLGVKVGTLRKWENDVAEPRANRLQMLAGLLNVSISWLLLGESEGLPEPEVFIGMPGGKSVVEDGGRYASDLATFGDRLRFAREELGITPEDLARKMDVKKKTLLSWEDDLAEPRANSLLGLSGCLGVSLRWLLTGEDESGRHDQDRSVSAKT